MTGARVALVTGGARGIGAAIAVALSEQGCSVAVVDRCADDPALAYSLATPAELEAVADACGAADDRAIGIIADVRDQSAVDAAVIATTKHFGGLDIAVAAAGAIAVSFVPRARDDVARGLGIAVTAVALGVGLAMLPGFHYGQHGGLQFAVDTKVSSMGGAVGLPMLSAYVAAKHAANGLVRSMAAELGREGITVNAIAPGSTTTDMLAASAKVYGLTDFSGLIGLHLLERPLHPDEVAAVAAFICQPESSGVTGAVLPVDAGATSQ